MEVNTIPGRVMVTGEVEQVVDVGQAAAAALQQGPVVTARGRPPSGLVKRTAKLQISLTPAEFEYVRGRAFQARVSSSEYIRRLVQSDAFSASTAGTTVSTPANG